VEYREKGNVLNAIPIYFPLHGPFACLYQVMNDLHKGMWRCCFGFSEMFVANA
jgi:hypothetical protein